MDKTAIVILVIAFVIVMNVISFALMGHDKRCARKGTWRVSEKTLFLAAACFGGLGGVRGMNVWHHKTQHWDFRVFFPVFLIVQILLLGAGAWLLFR